MSVFKNYANYYDVLYQDKDYESEYNYIRSLLQLYHLEPKHVIELGCGSGTHACLFVSDNMILDGVDISPEMLALASDKKAGLQKKISDRLRLHLGDVRTVRLKLKGDLVFSLFHVASYQCNDEDVLSYFLTAKEHCNDGGLFIFDFWYGPAVVNSPPYDRERKIETSDYRILRSTKAKMHAAERLVEMDISLHISKAGYENQETINEKHIMRYFFRKELTDFLNLAGFDLVEIFGWMKQAAATADDWYAIAVARPIK